MDDESKRLMDEMDFLREWRRDNARRTLRQTLRLLGRPRPGPISRRWLKPSWWGDVRKAWRMERRFRRG